MINKEIKFKAITKSHGEEIFPYAINFQKKFMLYGIERRMSLEQVDMYVLEGEEWKLCNFGI